jgi:hypothetical protein
MVTERWQTTLMDRECPSLYTTTFSNNFLDRSTSIRILADKLNHLFWVTSSIVKGVLKPEVISSRVFLLQYSWGKCMNLTHIWA